MTEDKKQPKELPGLQKVVSKEFIGNAIALIIVGLGSWGMTFYSTWGPAKGMGTYLGFIACMIPFFTVIQTLIPLINKRRELVHGKWELKEDEVQNPTEPLLNIWSAFLPRAFVLGFGSMLVVLALIKVSSWQPTPFLTTLIVIIVTIINTSLLLKRFMPSTLLSYAMALRNGEKQSPQPLAGYLTVEHIIPFILLQGYINACVSNRALHFELDKANVGYVPTEALLPDAL
ncbi:MAG: hypothetical protein JRF40_08330, partial [Deltaproteobacteria bacterium]|nr:hypothetical protein [Deltaproteobacteria bacterium]